MSKSGKNFCQQFFFAFFSHHYGFTNYLEIINFEILISYLEEESRHLKFFSSRTSTSRNKKSWKSYKFILNPKLWSFQSDLALLGRAISPNPYKTLTWNIQYYHILYIVLTWQILIKFWDVSCPSLNYFASFGVEWPICDFGADISIIHVCILMQELCFEF